MTQRQKDWQRELLRTGRACQAINRRMTDLFRANPGQRAGVAATREYRQLWNERAALLDTLLGHRAEVSR